METRLKKSTIGILVLVFFLFLVLITGYRMTFAIDIKTEHSSSVDVNNSVYRENAQEKQKQAKKEEAVRGENEIKPPKLVKKVDPIYPDKARKAGIEGDVTLEVKTDTEGKVKSVEILKSVPLLDEAAVDAVKKWEFKPMSINGRPRGNMFTVTFRFRLIDKEKTDIDSSEIAFAVIGGVQGGVVGGILGGVEGGIAGGVEGGVIGGVEGGGVSVVEGGVIGGVLGGVQGGVEGQILVFGDFERPTLIKKIEPVYPEAARKAGIEGELILELTIDKNGRVKSAKVLRSIPALDTAAIDAVKQWIYQPYIIDGKPRSVMFTVKVRFRLD